MLAHTMISPALRLVSALALFALGCPSDDEGGDTGASTADDHGSEEHGSEEHGSEHASEESGAGDPAAMLCSCLLANCHDPYHDKWGENEMTAEQSCLTEVEALPVNGSDIEMGNFIECRAHFCELAADDESVCPNALGEAVCM